MIDDAEGIEPAFVGIFVKSMTLPAGVKCGLSVL